MTLGELFVGFRPFPICHRRGMPTLSKQSFATPPDTEVSTSAACRSPAVRDQAKGRRAADDPNLKLEAPHGTDSSQTPRWRKTDSNLWFRISGKRFFFLLYRFGAANWQGATAGFDDRSRQVYHKRSQAGPGNDIHGGSPSLQKAPTRGAASLCLNNLAGTADRGQPARRGGAAVPPGSGDLREELWPDHPNVGRIRDNLASLMERHEPTAEGRNDVMAKPEVHKVGCARAKLGPRSGPAADDRSPRSTPSGEVVKSVARSGDHYTPHRRRG
jgi:hypothetical protein